MYRPDRPAPTTTASTSRRPGTGVCWWVISGCSSGGLGGELAVDGVGGPGDACRAAGQHVDHREEAVHLAVEDAAAHGDTGPLQGVGVLLALLAQHVVLGEQDDRRGEPGEVRGLR